MQTLVILHVATEGPGTLGTFLQSRGAILEEVALHDGEGLPEDPAEWDLIISMGGPMNVDEEETYPFLRDETEFLGRALEADVPVLGVCLGAQMIAKAAGARVVPSPEKELGWGRISLTDAGRRSPIFRDLPDTLDVLQWHGDMFEIPEGGELLASSTACPHQAFHYGNALGLQFHVEATKEMVALWFQDSPALDGLLRRYVELEDSLSRQAEQLYRNFLTTVT